MAADAEQLPIVSLSEISRVLDETARILRHHAAIADGLGRREVGPPPEETDEGLTAADVRAIIAVRWMRRRYLGFEATDAAWSMMLELFAARLEGRSVSQTRLGIAAAVPQTSALHVTRRMLERGVFTSAADPDDKRLVLIGLSDDAVERIGAYLAAGYGMTA